MSHLFWRAPTALLAALAIVLPAAAQAPAGAGTQNKNQSTQNSNQAAQGSSQAQTNANATGQTNASGAARGTNAQGTNARQEKNLQGQADRNNSTQNAGSNLGTQQRNANLQGQAGTDNRLRSDQNMQRTNRDARSARRDDRAQRRTAMRPNDMRGPDIGLWFNHRNRDGLVISDISNRGAISKLGFREGDRIVSVNGRRVTREPEFIEFLQASDADRVPVIITRDGREETIFVQPSVLTQDFEVADAEPLEQFGIVLDDRYDDRIVVWKVVPRSPAYYAGLREGDVITTLGDRPYRTRTEFEKGIVGLKSGEANIQVRRGDRTRDLSVDVPEFERSDRLAERKEAGSNERTDGRGRENSERSALHDSNRSEDRDRDNDRRDNDNRRSNDNRSDRQQDNNGQTDRQQDNNGPKLNSNSDRANGGEKR
jgi:C-terminal processing protease CtpA/Prc